MRMSITESQRRNLRRQAHHLKPVVLVGAAGLSDAVLNEIELALEHHELIKVRVSAPDRASRDDMIRDICARSGAELVQRVGNIASLFRRNPERPRVNL